MLAAVSGGSDSVALVHILRALADAGELCLAGVVHFNHQLRPSAGRRRAFAARLAASLDWPFRRGTRRRARARGRDRQSIEDAARAARYEFFDRRAGTSRRDVVALGHTRDDQAETVLLRLTRGAGPRGLAGMHPRNGAVDPSAARAAVATSCAHWLAERSHAFVDDESNQDVSIPRNRVRAELLPLLETRFNPAIVDVLADEAEVVRESLGLDGRDGVRSRRAQRPPQDHAPMARRTARSTSRRCAPRRSRCGARCSGA